MRGNSGLAENQLASRGEICAMELVNSVIYSIISLVQSSARATDTLQCVMEHAALSAGSNSRAFGISIPNKITNNIKVRLSKTGDKASRSQQLPTWHAVSGGSLCLFIRAHKAISFLLSYFFIKGKLNVKMVFLPDCVFHILFCSVDSDKNWRLDTKSNSQLLAHVSFVFRDKILKHIHTH